jgi:hypothetical protein
METISTKEHTEAHGDKVAGYRKLNDTEIDLINEVKQAGANLGSLLDRISSLSNTDKADGDPVIEIDPRWLAMARTDLQVGIMKLVRSIARPQGF